MSVERKEGTVFREGEKGEGKKEMVKYVQYREFSGPTRNEPTVVCKTATIQANPVQDQGRMQLGWDFAALQSLAV